MAHRKIEFLINAIETLRLYNKRMEAQQALILLYLYQAGETSPINLEKQLGLSGAAVSRNLYQLSIHKTKGIPGMGLLDIQPDPMDRRYKIISLTEEGLDLMKEVIKLGY
jgi:DNA-binding MarR family transcriptional regulator